MGKFKDWEYLSIVEEINGGPSRICVSCAEYVRWGRSPLVSACEWGCARWNSVHVHVLAGLVIPQLYLCGTCHLIESLDDRL